MAQKLKFRRRATEAEFDLHTCGLCLRYAISRTHHSSTRSHDHMKQEHERCRYMRDLWVPTIEARDVRHVTHA
ncbi:hypothetical protein RSAG8_06046, partial [Rhizoctonia solani AG-8 WAC10335]